MPELIDLNEDSPAKLSRRNVVVGTAWAVPAIALVGAAPAMALSLEWKINAPAGTITSANVNSYTVSGTGVTGKTVTLAVTGQGGTSLSPSPTAQVDSNGEWSITLNLSPLEIGTVTFTPTSGSAVFSPTYRTANKTVDTISPKVDVVLKSQNNNNKKAKFTITLGTATNDIPSATITAKKSGSTSVSKTVGSSGDVELNLSGTGTWTVTVTQEDVAGNTGTAVTSVTFP